MVITPRLIASAFLLIKYIFYVGLEVFPLPPNAYIRVLWVAQHKVPVTTHCLFSDNTHTNVRSVT